MAEKFTKKDLAEKIAEKFDITKKASLEMIEFACDQVVEQLKNDVVVDFNHLGKLEIKHRAAREGVNPITKEKIQIAAKNTISFKASKSLKEIVK